MDPLFVALGGTLGATLRYAVGVTLGPRAFPWATLLVNALGSLVLAIVLAMSGRYSVVLFAGVGFCGAFTTFSTLSYQTHTLWEREQLGLALLNGLANLVISLAVFWIAWILLQ